MSVAVAAESIGAAGARALGQGAVRLDGAIAHYGNVAGEYRALCAGRALVDLGHMEVLTVSGPDRLSWLTTLSTQDVRALAPGQSRELLILDPNGRVEHAAFVLDDATTTYLVLDAGRAAACADFLASMRFMLRVEVEARPDLRAVGAALHLDFVADVAAGVADVAAGAPVGVAGGGEAGAGTGERLRLALRALLERATGSSLVWVDPWPGPDPRSATYYAGAHPGEQSAVGLALVGAATPAADLLAAGLAPAGFLAWEALRVERWRPRLGREVDERCVPHELDWLRSAVHLDKGCYRGQEAVARIVNLGRPPRRLAFLHLDGGEEVLPAPGSPVLPGSGDAASARPVGAVTSAVLHPVLGPVALAMLKRSVAIDSELLVRAQVPTEGGEEVTVDVPATQEEIVNPEGKSSASPAQRPGAELRGR
ncbi:folate-binding protein [Buchananella felis]|uniref:CAF17-like 4Fe-4S cluster assembly/insertion protein YgfZ n=1 Tax=Buchananella felis TaxID=3231492 RepID=UPI00352991BF